MKCAQCGVELPSNALVCPACRALVHADMLKTLAAKAEGAALVGSYSDALTHWRKALELLPAGTSQHEAVRAKVNELVRRLDQAPVVEAKKPKWAAMGGTLGVIGLLVWKFKFLLILILTKGKLLLLGLMNATTLFSMLLSMGIFWNLWGWKFAVGFFLSIYVHEMGHIYQLRRYGIKSTAPMFIPGFGALIRQQQYPASAHEDAKVGLAGPIWGLGAAVFCYAIHLGTGLEIFAALARSGAWLNLLNLIPVWQLDGSHGFKALSSMQRGLIVMVMAGMWFLTGDTLLVLIFIVAGVRAFQKAPAESDWPVFAEFALLVVTLSVLAAIKVNV